MDQKVTRRLQDLYPAGISRNIKEKIMARKVSAFTAQNLDLFSGVFAVIPTRLRPASSLEGALRHTPDAFLPLGLTAWNDVKIAQAVSPLHDVWSTSEAVAFVAYDHSELEAAAKLNKLLGIPNDGLLKSFNAFNAKTEIYAKLSSAGLMPGVKHFRCKSKDLAKYINTSGIAPSNVVIKPAIGSGGQGLFRMPSAVDVKELVKGYSTTIGLQPADLELAVMEYIDGGGMGVEEICIDGVRLGGSIQFLASHDKILSDNSPPYRDKIISSPGETFLDEWRPLVERWLTELGADDTTFHIEARVHGKEIIPIDFAAQPAGGFISSMSAATSGVDLRLVHLYLMAGLMDHAAEALQAGVPTHKASAIGAFYMQGKSRVEMHSLSDLEAKLDRSEIVLGYHLSVQTGASGVLFPSASLSLCVGATNRDEAVSLMKSIAADEGFASSAPFLSSLG